MAQGAINVFLIIKKKKKSNVWVERIKLHNNHVTSPRTLHSISNRKDVTNINITILYSVI